MSYKRRWNDRRQAETARPRPLRPRLCSAFVVVQTCSCARIPYRDTHTSCLIQTSIIPPPDYLHRLPLLLWKVYERCTVSGKNGCTELLLITLITSAYYATWISLNFTNADNLGEISNRWWVPPRPLLAVPNVTAHPSTATVPTSYYLMWHYNCLCTVKPHL